MKIIFEERGVSCQWAITSSPDCLEDWSGRIGLDTGAGNRTTNQTSPSRKRIGL